MKWMVYIGLSLLFFTACESATHVDKEAEIEQKVQERLAEYKQIITTKCRQKVLEKAELLADSIILERARLLTDSLAKPDKPIRPEQPEIMQAKDSLLQLTPIFDTVRSKSASNTLGEI